jgi:predicted enzyme related to lactoylglutathione lyase
VTSGIRTIIYPVKDLARAKKLYGALLGVEPYADQPYYVGFKVDDKDIGLDPHGHDKGMTGPIGYYLVPDIQAALQKLQDGGAEALQPVKDVGGGMLIASVKDVDGNVVALIQEP